MNDYQRDILKEAMIKLLDSGIPLALDPLETKVLALAALMVLIHEVPSPDPRLGTLAFFLNGDTAEPLPISPVSSV